MQEVFRDINDCYEVSDLGRVFRKEVAIKAHANGSTRVTGRQEKKPSDNGKGYLFVWLYEDNKRVRKYVHILVADAFLSPDLDRPCINHKNGIKEDNRVVNLERVTYAENNKHARDTGLVFNVGGGKSVAQYDKEGNQIGQFKSVSEAARQTKVNRASIAECVKPFRSNQGHTAGGFIWRYI